MTASGGFSISADIPYMFPYMYASISAAARQIIFYFKSVEVFIAPFREVDGSRRYTVKQ